MSLISYKPFTDLPSLLTGAENENCQDLHLGIESWPTAVVLWFREIAYLIVFLERRLDVCLFFFCFFWCGCLSHRHSVSTDTQQRATQSPPLTRTSLTHERLLSLKTWLAVGKQGKTDVRHLPKGFASKKSIPALVNDIWKTHEMLSNFFFRSEEKKF